MEEEREGEEGDEEFVEEDELERVLTLEGQEEGGAEMEEGDGEEEGEEEPHMEWASHSGDIFSVDLAPPLVASGGEDDKALIHDLDTGQLRLVCDGHRDSVTWVRFNSAKTLLATGDMSGLIQVWDVPSLTLKRRLDEASELEWLVWHPAADILVAGGGDGVIWMWLVGTGTAKVFAAAQGSGATAGTLLGDGKRLLAGYASGATLLWELKDGSSVALRSAAGPSPHAGPVTALSVAPNGQLAASASADGSVGVANLNSLRYEALFDAADAQGPSSSTAPGEGGEEEGEQTGAVSVESLSFSEDSEVLAAGTTGGQVLLWRLRTGTVTTRLEHPLGVVKVEWLGPHSLLSASLDGRLRLWDSRNAQLLSQYNAHSQPLLDFAALAQPQLDGHFVLTASTNSSKLFLVQ